jgi:hypothetical protein
VALAIFRAGIAQRITTGFSFDDAGIGNLTDRTVEIYNCPSSEQPNFIDFYHRFYPGVRVVFKRFPETQPERAVPPERDDPGPCRGRPRVQPFARRFQLLHNEVSSDQAVEIFRRGLTGRSVGLQGVTTGWSWDDAALGDADERVIEFFGCPASERARAQTWFDTNYLGVTVVFRQAPKTEPARRRRRRQTPKHDILPRFVGMNARGLLYYGREELPSSQVGNQDQFLDAAKEMGVRVVRAFVASERRTPGQVVDLLLTALDKCRSRDIQLIACLHNVFSDTPFKVKGDDPFYQNSRLRPDYFLGGFGDHYLPFVRAVVGGLAQRAPGHPALLAWELGNEFGLGFPTTRELREGMVSFVRETCAAIRSLDMEHRIAGGFINSVNAAAHDAAEFKPDFARRLYGPLDIITLHFYLVPGDAERGRCDLDLALARELGKPAIVEEFGMRIDDHPDRAALTRSEIDRWFTNGVTGFMQWGFMPLSQDNGDGDGDFGMDRALPGHRDYDQLAEVFRARALLPQA